MKVKRLQWILQQLVSHEFKKSAMSKYTLRVLCIGLSSLHLFSLHNPFLIVPMVAAEKVKNAEGPF